MPSVEFVWVQHCAACGREHRHVEAHQVASAEEEAHEASAFEARCAHWSRLHLDQIDSRRAPTARR